MKNPKKLSEMFDSNFAVSNEELFLAQKIVQNAQVGFSNIQDIQFSEEECQSNFANLQNEDVQTQFGEVINFFKEIHKIRLGKDDSTGKQRPRAINFSEAVQAYYGVDVLTFLRSFGIDSSDSLSTIASKLGRNGVNVTEVNTLLTDYASMDFASIESTKDINSAYRFIIPEIILNAVDLGYKGGAKHMDWIARVENVATYNNVVMPHITEGDTMPGRINEGAAVPFGTLKFGKKNVSLIKVGIGIRLTDELIEQSSINMLNLFLTLVGVRMSRGADVEAMRVLISGEQADLSEQAPLVGVLNTGAGVQHYDMDNVMEQMNMLNQPCTTLIGRKALLINDLNEAKPQRDRETVRAYAEDGGAKSFSWALPAGQLMFVDKMKAMCMLNYGGMRVGQERDVVTGTTVIAITKYVGFAIVKRDARVILDSNVAFSAFPFPAFMDVEAQMALGYK